MLERFLEAILQPQGVTEWKHPHRIGIRTLQRLASRGFRMGRADLLLLQLLEAGVGVQAALS